MKTADLIPLILLELNECDKYGFELTKSIETKSKGKIIIKFFCNSLFRPQA